MVVVCSGGDTYEIVLLFCSLWGRALGVWCFVVVTMVVLKLGLLVMVIVVVMGGFEFRFGRYVGTNGVVGWGGRG